VIILLEKVGTIATIWVNGHQIGNADNVFRTYYMQIESSILKAGENKLRVDISSTVRYTYEQEANYTNKRLVKDFFQEHVWVSPAWIEHARSQQTDFGWDWSPALAP